MSEGFFERSKGRISLVNYKDGSVEIVSHVTDTSVILPAADYLALCQGLAAEEHLQALIDRGVMTREEFIRAENAG